MLTRAQAASIVDYSERVSSGEYTRPEDQTTLRAMSTLLDQSMQRTYQSALTCFQDTREYQLGLRELEQAPRLCKGFSVEKRMLSSLTDFERANVLKEWIVSHPNIRQMHTLTLASGDPDSNQYVPVYFRPPKKAAVTAMHVCYGNASGDLKSPKYPNWAANDPRGTAQEVFISPLNALEIARQPHCLAALVMKAASAMHRLPSKWRYEITWQGNPFPAASVELPKQFSKKSLDIKAQSAGFNLTSFVQADRFRDYNLLKTLNYEEYALEGYRDDDHPRVTPKEIVQTFPKAIRGNTQDLDRISQKLLGVHLGKSQNGHVREQTTRMLFDINSEL